MASGRLRLQRPAAAVTADRDVFGILRNRDFRRILAAEVVSDVGNFVTFVALAVRVHDITGTTLAVGFAFALRAVPWFTLGPVAGVFVDRADRRVVMVVSDLARAALVTVLAFTNSVGQLYLIAFLSGCFGPFFRPARHALLPVVAPGDQYVKALAVAEIAHQSLHTVGPAMGGLAVALVGARRAFLLDAVTFLVSAALVVGVRVRGAVGTRPTSVAEVGRDLAEGARTVWRDRILRSLFAARCMWILGEAGVLALLVSYIRDDLGRSGSAYGFALAVGGAGTAIVAFVLAKLGPRTRRVRWMAVGVVSQALFVGVAFRPGFAALLGIMAAEGAIIGGWALYDDVITAEHVPDAMRGRVFALSGSTGQLADFVGSLGLAALGEAIGVSAGIAISGALASVLGLALLAPALAALRAEDAARHALS
ncbi:MAG: MFS transporter [Actinomycetota bacterium]